MMYTLDRIEINKNDIMTHTVGRQYEKCAELYLLDRE